MIRVAPFAEAKVWFEKRLDAAGGVNANDWMRHFQKKGFVLTGLVERDVKEAVERERGVKFEYNRFTYVPAGTTQRLLQAGYTVYA